MLTGTQFCQLGTQDGFATDQYDFDIGDLAGKRDGSRHRDFGAVITAHAVDGYSDGHDPERSWLAGFGYESLMRGLNHERGLHMKKRREAKSERGSMCCWLRCAGFYGITAVTDYSSFLVFKTLRPR